MTEQCNTPPHRLSRDDINAICHRLKFWSGVTGKEIDQLRETALLAVSETAPPSEPPDWPELGEVAGPPNEPAALVAWISTAQKHGADELVRRMQKRLLLWEKAHLSPELYERIKGLPIYTKAPQSAVVAPVGWCIRHVDGRWRTMDTIGMPDFTNDPAKALCCRLREHVEAYAADDPDDVRIVEVSW